MGDQTNANWSAEQQALLLAWRDKRFGAFGPGVTGLSITSDAHRTFSTALGDVDGDGDLVAGNDGPTNRLYPNNGTSSILGQSPSDVLGRDRSIPRRGRPRR